MSTTTPSTEPSPGTTTTAPAATPRTRPTRRDALLIATVLAAVLLFQVVMAGSYIGAFHNPTPHDVPIGVVAPTADLATKVASLIPNPDGYLDTRVVADEATARQQILDGELYGALVVTPSGDRLLTASAASVAIADSLTSGFTAEEQHLDRSLTVEDVAPVPREDSRGLTPFYLVLAWVVGGYLGATVIGLVRGMSAAGWPFAWRRIGALAAYAVVSGFALTVLTQVAFGIVGGHLLAVAAVGALVVLATALTTAGLQSLFGIAGTAVVLVLFVALGNPSSGGPAARPLLPGPWRQVGGWLIPGAGTDLARSVVYFGGHALTTPLLVLGVWAVAGAVLAIVVGHRREPAMNRTELELAAASLAVVP